ncbi:MAG TPA: metallophosphoesterase [Bacteroidetes bacterium]|nr:metallophosphoesterase [Bacteroidota bacterium]
MKIVAISDTHSKHLQLHLPIGDLLIHAGDVSGRGTEAEVLSFLDWFASLDFKYKIFIAGNHDYFFERMTDAYVRNLIPDNIIYLNDEGTEIEGIKIWGSPVQPWFYDWAFNRRRGREIDKHWKLIPDDTDILITHGPAHGILDRTRNGSLAGCEDLLRRIKKVKPKYHIAGHIHEAYGMVEKDGTTFINASVLNLRYELVNEPIVFEI